MYVVKPVNLVWIKIMIPIQTKFTWDEHRSALHLSGSGASHWTEMNSFEPSILLDNIVELEFNPIPRQLLPTGVKHLSRQLLWNKLSLYSCQV